MIISAATPFALPSFIVKIPNAYPAPKAKLWTEFNQSGGEMLPPDINLLWAQFLKKYIIRNKNQINLVRYKNVSQNDRDKLRKYIDNLTRQPVLSLQLQDQMCLWINLYNALTIDVVLEHYPIRSIRDIDISPGLFSDGPWGKKLINIEKQDVSLDDIEHRILRPIWKDPRIHYAVNCASIGCPNLQNQPFTSKNLNHLLNKGAREFINHMRGIHISDKQNLIVSSIYSWFKTDFGTTDKNIIAHIRNYAKPKLKIKLQNTNKIYDHQYDWTINDA